MCEKRTINIIFSLYVCVLQDEEPDKPAVIEPIVCSNEEPIDVDADDDDPTYNPAMENGYVYLPISTACSSFPKCARLKYEIFVADFQKRKQKTGSWS